MNYKYNIENLEWQQFETLSFKCLQIDISKSIMPIEGGNDKGREFVYEGVTDFFTKSKKPLKYIFQSKHKSTLDFKTLKTDLKKELEKVYVKNELTSDIYCLVTNISLTGNQYDELQKIFQVFISENELFFDLNFRIYSYRHFESCIDKNSELKFLFPTIIKNADFKFLLESIVKKEELNNVQSFISLFQRNREKFITTRIFDEALEKLHDNNILLLSGPPKSGKTFTAEMVIFNKYFIEDFQPYNIISIQDFDRFYDKDKKQIFLFDDTFGKYDLDFNRADIINRKIEFLFDLADSKHKCIFTSREYVFRAFTNYSDKEVKSLIEKINVDVNRLTKFEKESIFRRYYRILTNSSKINFELDGIIEKEEFTPEVIRSYFENTTTFNFSEFLDHINSPNAYLKKIFTNLSEEKRIILLSILLSLDKKIHSIGYAHMHICEDLQKPKKLIDIKDELEILTDSLISHSHQRYSFYHPTMVEFFVSYLDKENIVYRDILFRNINIDLLFITSFNSRLSKNKISVTENDLLNLNIGLNRFISNPNVELNSINGLFSWLNETDKHLYFQLQYKASYKKIIESLIKTISNLDLDKFSDTDEEITGAFFRNIKRFYSKKYDKLKTIFNQSQLSSLLNSNKGKDRYWFLVFSVIPFLQEENVLNERYIGRNWLNKFYLELKNGINQLGFELYGNAYPKFVEPTKYKLLLEEKKYKEAQHIAKKSKADYKQKTNSTWFKRYSECKEKIMLIKSVHPMGYKIYERLIPLFSHLSALEDNQKNRYIYNKKRKWWQ